MSLIVIEGSNGSGKTEVINRIIKKYDIIDKKSIPDWYRSKIEFARECPLDIKKKYNKENYKSKNTIFP